MQPARVALPDAGRMAGAEPAAPAVLSKWTDDEHTSMDELETLVESGVDKSRWGADIAARLAQIEAETESLVKQLAENEEYEKKLEGFKTLLPAIGFGPMPRAEAQTLIKSSIESPLGWPAEIGAELARVDTENEEIVKKLLESENLKQKLKQAMK